MAARSLSSQGPAALCDVCAAAAPLPRPLSSTTPHPAPPFAPSCPALHPSLTPLPSPDILNTPALLLTPLPHSSHFPHTPASPLTASCLAPHTPAFLPPVLAPLPHSSHPPQPSHLSSHTPAPLLIPSCPAPHTSLTPLPSPEALAPPLTPS